MHNTHIDTHKDLYVCYEYQPTLTILQTASLMPASYSTFSESEMSFGHLLRQITQAFLSLLEIEKCDVFLNKNSSYRYGGVAGGGVLSISSPVSVLIDKNSQEMGSPGIIMAGRIFVS